MKKAFTLAEVLITLGIIGIVAAMTLPTLINKYEKSVATTKLKRIYSLLTNATQRAINDYGPSEYWDYPMSTEDLNPTGITLDQFFERYYAPYPKSSGSSVVKYTDGYDVYNFNKVNVGYNNHSIGRGSRFKLNDGMCITMWANNQYFVFTADLNCEKPPNIVGKDVFDIAELYIQNNRKLEIPWNKTLSKGKETRDFALEKCKANTYQSGGPTWCFSLFVYDGWQFKKDYPW